MKKDTYHIGPLGPRRREAKIRIPFDVAKRIRDGHPWIFSDALQGRSGSFSLGQLLDVIDPDGNFIARAIADPNDNLTLRVFSTTPNQVINSEYFRMRISQALELRRQLIDFNPLACFRLINGDCEGIPGITVDQFGQYLVICCYSIVMEKFIEPLSQVLGELTRPHGIYLQKRYSGGNSSSSGLRPAANLVWGELAPTEFVVSEGTTQYYVDVTSPANQGIYPDMRLGRGFVGSIAGGKRVLNCFSYTGSFSVVAALNGAQSVTSVDTSSRAHARARRNFALNKLDPNKTDYEFLHADTFSVLTKMEQRKQFYDLIILDPPTFASPTGRGRSFTALKDYAELIFLSLKVLNRGGIICAASNAAKLPPLEMDRAIGRGASRSDRTCLITHRLGQPPDYPSLPTFPESQFLKFFAVLCY